MGNKYKSNKKNKYKSNKKTSMKKILFASLCVAILMSCGQKQGSSEQGILERIDAAVKAASGTKQAEETSSSATTESMTTSSSATNSETPTSAFGTYEFSDNFNPSLILKNIFNCFSRVSCC